MKVSCYFSYICHYLKINAGAVYVYIFYAGVYSEVNKLIASDGMPGDGFGGDVYVSSDVLIIGASRDDEFAGNSGLPFFL